MSTPNVLIVYMLPGETLSQAYSAPACSPMALNVLPSESAVTLVAAPVAVCTV